MGVIEVEPSGGGVRGLLQARRRVVAAPRAADVVDHSVQPVGEVLQLRI